MSSSTDHVGLRQGPGHPGPVASQSTDAVDPELLALPAPPRGRRLLSMALMASVLVVAVGLLAELRADLAYGFSSDRPADLGDIRGLELGSLVSNRYVRVRGNPMLGRMVRYERALSGQSYAVFPLAGQRQVFVQVPLEALADPARAAQGEFRGRLMTFGELGGRFQAVREYLADELGLPVTSESFVVLAEEPPESYRWALSLSALCLGVIALTAGLMFRWFKALDP